MVALSSLDLSRFRALPARVRGCVFWETSPDDEEPDPEFVKEAWILQVLLEWGACGVVAEHRGTTVGAALYAPPRLVPRAEYFGAGPVSADAILLTTLDATSNHTGVIQSLDDDSRADVRTDLLAGVVADLRGRGVRALETFGRNHSLAPATHAQKTTACRAGLCMTETSFLVENGFTIVQEHEDYPRLRLDIETDLLWKADVERALDQLVVESAIPMRTFGTFTRRVVPTAGPVPRVQTPRIPSPGI